MERHAGKCNPRSEPNHPICNLLMAEEDPNKRRNSVIECHGLPHRRNFQNSSNHIHISLHLAQNSAADHKRIQGQEVSNPNGNLRIDQGKGRSFGHLQRTDP